MNISFAENPFPVEADLDPAAWELATFALEQTQKAEFIDVIVLQFPTSGNRRGGSAKNPTFRFQTKQLKSRPTPPPTKSSTETVPRGPIEFAIGSRRVPSRFSRLLNSKLLPHPS